MPLMPTSPSLPYSKQEFYMTLPKFYITVKIIMLLGLFVPNNFKYSTNMLNICNEHCTYSQHYKGCNT